MEVVEHSLKKIILWLHEIWGSFNEECLLVTSSTTENAPSDGTTTDGVQSNTSNADYRLVTSMFLGMHIFTLIIWA